MKEFELDFGTHRMRVPLMVEHMTNRQGTVYHVFVGDENYRRLRDEVMAGAFAAALCKEMERQIVADWKAQYGQDTAQPDLTAADLADLDAHLAATPIQFVVENWGRGNAE